MAFKKGQKKIGGRKKGIPNKRTEVVRDMLDGMKCNPIKLLADFALGKPIKGRLPGTPESASPIMLHPTLDQMLSARHKLSEFYAPRLKSIEHSGSIGTHEATLEELADEAPESLTR